MSTTPNLISRFPQADAPAVKARPEKARLHLDPLVQNRLPDKERSLRRASDVAVVVCLLIPMTAYAFCGPTIPRSQVALGSIICVLGLLPLILYLRDAERPPIPFLPLTGLFYMVSCGLPAFYDFTSTSITESWFAQINNAALIAIACAVSALYTGYYISRATLFRRLKAIRLPRTFQLSRLAAALWLLLGVHIVGILFPNVTAKLHLDQFVLYAGYVPYGMFYILWRRGRLSRGSSLIVVGVVLPIETILRFVSGSVAPLLLLALFLVVVVWIESHMVRVSVVVGGIILFGILNYTKQEYRNLTWGAGPYAQANPLEKAQIFGRTTIEQFSSTSANDYSSEVLDRLANRVSVVGFLTYVMDQTPGIVPYWNGETYVVLIYKLIPRAVWADKPTEDLGYSFTARYAMRALNDESTSFNVPWVVEIYANFGWSGILWGMAAIGVLIAFVEAKLNSRYMTTLELMIGVTILFDLCYQESNFSLMVGSKVLLGIALYGFFYLMLREGKHLGPGPIEENMKRGSVPVSV